MKILVVSFRFPPFNSAGAVSIGKTAKYLVSSGHDIRVVTAGDQRLPRTLRMDVDPDLVHATRWFDPLRAAAVLAGGKERVAASGFSAGRKHHRLLHRLGSVYRRVMIPDREIGWALPALRTAARLVEQWHPDVIYASAPPYTSLIVASALSHRSGVPWVAGLTDLWSDNPYNPYRGTRFDHLYRALEVRVLSSAAGIVVTTDEAAEIIQARYRKPIATVMNGYDAKEVRERTRRPTSEELRIVHTGVLMHELRDPTPLFLAMNDLRARGHRVVVDFFGRDSAIAFEAAQRIGVSDLVSVHGPISHEEVLEVQRDADILLVLQWNGDRIACPQKIFEYAAARRPILSIGPDDGPVARLLHQFEMGVVARHPEDIARELLRQSRLKRDTGQVPDVSQEPPGELSRSRQIEKMVELLNHVAAA